MGATMLLDNEQEKYLGRLPTGWSIVKLQDRFTEPFIVRFPLVSPVHQTLTDAQLASIMRERFPDLIPTDSRTPESDGPPPEPANLPAPADQPSEQDDSKNAPEVTDEQRLLLDIIAHPTSGTVERYKRLGLSIGKGSRLQKQLLEKGLVRIEKVSTGKGGVKILALTEEGERMIADSAQPPSQIGRRGGLSHRYWIDRIARRFEQEGYKVEREHSIGGGSAVDLVVEKDGERLAIEVETGKSDIIANVEKCLNADFTKVFCVVPDQQAKEELELKFRTMQINANRVEIVTLKEMMDRKAADLTNR
jgi:DNA-binding MarR family transcriptional regulator